MDYRTLYTSALFSLFLSVSHANEIDRTLDHAQYSHLVKIISHTDQGYLPCTGTIIAQNWVITAAHCLTQKNERIIQHDITFSNGDIIQASDIYIHPDHATQQIDVALIRIDNPHPTKHVAFLNDKKIKINKNVDILGFADSESLKKSVMKLTANGDYPYTGYWQYEMANINRGKTELGDSGAPYILHDRIIAIHNGEQETNTYGFGNGAFATQIAKPEVKEFILSTLATWHHATLITGQHAVWLQNLHNTPQTLNASVSGDLHIIEEKSSCLTDLIKPFQRCKITLSNTSQTGNIFIDDHGVIKIER